MLQCHHRVAVIESAVRHTRQSSKGRVQRSTLRTGPSRLEQEAERALQLNTQEEERRLRRARVVRAVDLNKARPRVEGVLARSRRSMLGNECESQQWVVLEPSKGALSLSAHPPKDLAQSPAAPPSDLSSLFGRTCKVYSLARLESLTTNAAFRELFLRFEDHSKVLCLSGASPEEFEQWREALEPYFVESDVEETSSTDVPEEASIPWLS